MLAYFKGLFTSKHRWLLVFHHKSTRNNIAVYTSTSRKQLPRWTINSVHPDKGQLAGVYYLGKITEHEFYGVDNA